ncbi:YraN family protein [Uliginosibacterium sp. 31-16]|uniref:YraN family protein n=1 Tax=Uliginosibacterium sp. 31-16 TaxID=3068315 RepID=UPI003531F369
MQPAGARAERLAEQHLIAHGAKILARNTRYKGGEIDLIAEHAGHIVFVEVRLRKNSDFGGAAASITPAKQHRIVLAARHWLQGAGSAYSRRPCRFDAVLLDALDDKRAEWLQAAFFMDGF